MTRGWWIASLPVRFHLSVASCLESSHFNVFSCFFPSSLPLFLSSFSFSLSFFLSLSACSLLFSLLPLVQLLSTIFGSWCAPVFCGSGRLGCCHLRARHVVSASSAFNSSKGSRHAFAAAKEITRSYCGARTACTSSEHETPVFVTPVFVCVRNACARTCMYMYMYMYIIKATPPRGLNPMPPSFIKTADCLQP